MALESAERQPPSAKATEGQATIPKPGEPKTGSQERSQEAKPQQPKRKEPEITNEQKRASEKDAERKVVKVDHGEGKVKDDKTNQEKKVTFHRVKLPNQNNSLTFVTEKGVTKMYGKNGREYVVDNARPTVIKRPDAATGQEQTLIRVVNPVDNKTALYDWRTGRLARDADAQDAPNAATQPVVNAETLTEALAEVVATAIDKESQVAENPALQKVLAAAEIPPAQDTPQLRQELRDQNLILLGMNENAPDPTVPPHLIFARADNPGVPILSVTQNRDDDGRVTGYIENYAIGGGPTAEHIERLQNLPAFNNEVAEGLRQRVISALQNNPDNADQIRQLQELENTITNFMANNPNQAADARTLLNEIAGRIPTAQTEVAPAPAEAQELGALAAQMDQGDILGSLSDVLGGGKSDIPFPQDIGFETLGRRIDDYFRNIGRAGTATERRRVRRELEKERGGELRVKYEDLRIKLDSDLAYTETGRSDALYQFQTDILNRIDEITRANQGELPTVVLEPASEQTGPARLVFRYGEPPIREPIVARGELFNGIPIDEDKAILAQYHVTRQLQERWITSEIQDAARLAIDDRDLNQRINITRRQISGNFVDSEIQARFDAITTIYYSKFSFIRSLKEAARGNFELHLTRILGQPGVAEVIAELERRDAMRIYDVGNVEEIPQKIRDGTLGRRSNLGAYYAGLREDQYDLQQVGDPRKNLSGYQKARSGVMEKAKQAYAQVKAKELQAKEQGLRRSIEQGVNKKKIFELTHELQQVQKQQVSDTAFDAAEILFRMTRSAFYGDRSTDGLYQQWQWYNFPKLLLDKQKGTSNKGIKKNLLELAVGTSNPIDLDLLLPGLAANGMDGISPRSYGFLGGDYARFNPGGVKDNKLALIEAYAYRNSEDGILPTDSEEMAEEKRKNAKKNSSIKGLRFTTPDIEDRVDRLWKLYVTGELEKRGITNLNDERASGLISKLDKEALDIWNAAPIMYIDGKTYATMMKNINGCFAGDWIDYGDDLDKVEAVGKMIQEFLNDPDAKKIDEIAQKFWTRARSKEASMALLRVLLEYRSMYNKVDNDLPNWSKDLERKSIKDAVDNNTITDYQGELLKQKELADIRLKLPLVQKVPIRLRLTSLPRSTALGFVNARRYTTNVLRSIAGGIQEALPTGLKSFWSNIWKLPPGI